MIQELVEKQLRATLKKVATELETRNKEQLESVELVIKPKALIDPETEKVVGIGTEYFIRYQGERNRDITLDEVLSIE